jgi:hypothetical protein
VIADDRCRCGCGAVFSRSANYNGHVIHCAGVNADARSVASLPSNAVNDVESKRVDDDGDDDSIKSIYED